MTGLIFHMVSFSKCNHFSHSLSLSIWGGGICAKCSCWV